MLTYFLYPVRLLWKLNLFSEIQCHVLLKNFYEIFQNLYHFVFQRQKIVELKKWLISCLSTISFYFKIPGILSLLSISLSCFLLFPLTHTTGKHAVFNGIKCLPLKTFKRFCFYLLHVWRKSSTDFLTSLSGIHPEFTPICCCSGKGPRSRNAVHCSQVLANFMLLGNSWLLLVGYAEE